MSAVPSKESVSQDVRSVLLPEQRGLSLPDFLQSYKKLIGSNFPYQKFGCKSPIDFLISIPSYVFVKQIRDGSYHLTAVVDEKVKHIDKLVSKQKPGSKPKHQVQKFQVPKHPLNLPPRLTQRAYATTYANTKQTPMQLTWNQPIKQSPWDPPVPQQAWNPPATTTVSQPNLSQPVSRAPSISPTVLQSNLNKLLLLEPNGVSLSNLESKYKIAYNQILNFIGAGFSSLESCITANRDLFLLKMGNDSIVYHAQRAHIQNDPVVTSSVKSDVSKKASMTVEEKVRKYVASQEINKGMANRNIDKSPTKRSSLDTLDDFNTSGMIENCKKVLKQYKGGIWSSEFAAYYERLTQESFDPQNYGYYSFTELVAAFPNIFARKNIEESKKGFLVLPAGSALGSGKTATAAPSSNQHKEVIQIEFVIINIRKILQANPEGIKLDDFEHTYNINCSSPLQLQELGFDVLEKFLFVIREKVPLYVSSKGNVKIIHMLREKAKPETTSVLHKDSIPSDVVPPDTSYVQQSVPMEWDTSKYIPIYVATVVNPSNFWIQLRGESMSTALGTLQDDMEKFYYGPSGDCYKMKDSHVIVGASCIAIWPQDNHWYRIKVKSIPSLEFVEAFYVDYGTTEKIPRTLLRYMRKKFMKLPAQALKARLDAIRPSRNSAVWDPNVKECLMKYCIERTLMAMINEEKNGLYTILMCDTTTAADIHINDMLVQEGYAEFCVKVFEPNTSPIPTPAKEVKESAVPENLSQLVESFTQYVLYACANQRFAAQYLATLSPNSPPNPVLQQQLSTLAQNFFTTMVNKQLVSTLVASGASALGSSPQAIALTNPLAPLLANFSAMNPFSFGNQFGSTNQVPLTANLRNNVPQANLFGYNYANGGASGYSSVSTASVPPVPKNGAAELHEARQPSTVPISGHKHYMDASEQLLSSPSPTDRILTELSSSDEKYESDYYDVEDDEVFRQMCDEVGICTRRYVKRIITEDGYKFHIILYDDALYVSYGDVSTIIWRDKPPSSLPTILQHKNTNKYTSLVLPQEDNEAVYNQLELYHVNGIEETEDSSKSITVCPIIIAVEILNDFGHPSKHVREELIHEIEHFNPDDDFWLEFNHEDIAEYEEDTSSETDNDKIDKMCTYDLKFFLESLKYNRMKARQNENLYSEEEIIRNENLQLRVMQQMGEIQRISTKYTNALQRFKKSTVRH